MSVVQAQPVVHGRSRRTHYYPHSGLCRVLVLSDTVVVLETSRDYRELLQKLGLDAMFCVPNPLDNPSVFIPIGITAPPGTKGQAIDPERVKDSSILSGSERTAHNFFRWCRSAQPPAIIGYPFGMKSPATLKAPQTPNFLTAQDYRVRGESPAHTGQPITIRCSRARSRGDHPAAAGMLERSA